jgi:hypothetical protein
MEKKENVSNKKLSIGPLTKAEPVINDGVPEPLPNFKTRANFLMCILAPSGGGKSVLISNLVRKYYFKVFDKIYFCSSNVDEGKVYDKSYESIKFDDERVFDDINNEIADWIRNDITSDEDFSKKDFRALLIIDDLITSVMQQKMKKVQLLWIKSRHLKLSIILVSHKYNYIPRLLRTNMTHFIAFRSKSKKELENIYDDIVDLDEKHWMDVYNYATNEKYQFLYVVCNENPQHFYKNFTERLV